MTPGSDTALVLRSAIDGGRKLLASTIAGICTGLLIHATLSSLGLSAVLQASPQGYAALKFAGAGYMIYLGAKILYAAAKEVRRKKIENPDSFRPAHKTPLSEFSTGLMTNILNAKVAVFYITFLPQFIDPARNIFVQSILLSGGHILMSIVWLSVIGVFVGYFQNRLEKPKVRQVIETVTGLAFIGFGLRLAF